MSVATAARPAFHGAPPRLELVRLISVGACYLGGVEAYEPRVGAHHVGGVAPRGHAGEIALLDGAQDIGADAQLARGSGQVQPLALAAHSKHVPEGILSRHDLVSSISSGNPRSALVLVVGLEGLQRLEFHLIYQHFAGTASVGRAHDALFFQLIHYTPGAGVSDLQAALKVGC